jgi:hypothetical protein
MIDMYSKCHSMYFKWTYTIFVIVIRCTICNNVYHNELLLPRFINENVDIMFIREFGVRKSFVYRIH